MRTHCGRVESWRRTAGQRERAWSGRTDIDGSVLSRNNRISCFLNMAVQQHEERKSHVNRYRNKASDCLGLSAVVQRLASGLCAGLRALFVSGCWPAYPSLLIYDIFQMLSEKSPLGVFGEASPILEQLYLSSSTNIFLYLGKIYTKLEKLCLLSSKNFFLRFSEL